MATFAHADVLDGGLLAIKNTAVKMLLIKAYAAGDTYATVVGNMVAEAAMVAGDFTLGNGASSARQVVSATKTVNAANSSGAAPNLHIAFTDGAAKVLWVTNETSDQVITAGNPVTFPALTYTSNQPT